MLRLNFVMWPYFHHYVKILTFSNFFYNPRSLHNFLTKISLKSDDILIIKFLTFDSTLKGLMVNMPILIIFSMILDV
jgi:hypothetical protein